LFASSLISAGRVLELMGRSVEEASASTLRFRQHNLELFEKLHPHYRDQARFVAGVKAGRAQLEAQMAQERAERNAS
jgi:glutathione-regulated potassium-efflux system ancillary protein KefC